MPLMPALIKGKPIVFLRNNTGVDTPVNLFQNAFVPSNINARTTYTWDITAATFPFINYVTIQAKGSASSNFKLYTLTGAFTNASTIVAALNTLGIGIFTTYVLGGNTFITTQNDTIIYGDIDITNSQGFTISWQINFFVPVPTFEFHVKDLTLGGTQIFGVANQASGSTKIVVPDAIIGDDYLFEAGWDGVFHTSTATLFRNGVQINQQVIVDIFSGLDDTLPAFGTQYLLTIDVTA